MNPLRSLSYRPRGVDEDCTEKLFSEIPVMRCAGTAEVTRLEELWHKSPSVFEHLNLTSTIGGALLCITQR